MLLGGGGWRTPGHCFGWIYLVCRYTTSRKRTIILDATQHFQIQDESGRYVVDITQRIARKIRDCGSNSDRLLPGIRVQRRVQVHGKYLVAAPRRTTEGVVIRHGYCRGESRVHGFVELEL